MYIGEASNKTGASPRAIRLYEAQGLITPPARKGKYRTYSANDLDAIHIIKEAQSLGFRLAEIKTLLNSETSCTNFPWIKAIQLLKNKSSQIEYQVSQLNHQMKEVDNLIRFIQQRAE